METRLLDPDWAPYSQQFDADKLDQLIDAQYDFDEGRRWETYQSLKQRHGDTIVIEGGKNHGNKEDGRDY